MVDSWYCLDQIVAEGRSQVSRQSEVGKHKRRSVFTWALLSNEYFMHFFGTMSIVKLFHSFEYREIPGHNSLWRCPLYSSTICKSWIQLFAVSIFALPNNSPPFRLSHFASEKLLNVYVLHFLDKQCFPEFVLLITVVNDREKKVCFSENFHLQTKNIHNFFEDNTRFTPGIEAWSRATKKNGFSHGY